MVARSMWSGAVNFGPVCIPVKMYGATDADDEGAQFHQVRESDGARIGYRRYAKTDGAEVPYAEIAKGYEYGDRILIFTDDDMAKLRLATLKQVNIEHFCAVSQVSPTLREKDYFLAPESEAAQRAYRLLVLGLGDMAGIGKIAVRQRERLCMVTADGDVLRLTTLLWPEKLRDAPAVPVPVVTDVEVSLARQLIELMGAPFDPNAHVDNYRRAVQEMAEDKAAILAGQAPAEREPVPSGGEQALSLTETLAAYVAAAREKKGQAA